MKSRVLWWILIALVAAAIGRWTAPAVSDGQPKAAVAELLLAAGTRAEAPEVSAPEPVERPQLTVPVTVEPTWFVPPEVPAADARGLGFDPTNFLAGLPQQLDQTSDRAKSGNAAALGELADWLDYCDQSKRAAEVGSISVHTMFAGFKDAEVLNYFKQVASVCAAWEKRQPWLAAQRALTNEANRDLYARMRAGTLDVKGPMPVVFPQLLRQRALESGDLLSRVRARSPQPCKAHPPTADLNQQRAASLKLANCIYQQQLELLKRALAGGDPRVIAAMPKILSDSAWFPGSLPYLTQDQQFNQALWQLAGCASGLDCSGSGPLLREVCANAICGYRHARDYLADQRVTPATMRRVDSALPGLLAAIQANNLEAILGPPPAP